MSACNRMKQHKAEIVKMFEESEKVYPREMALVFCKGGGIERFTGAKKGHNVRFSLDINKCAPEAMVHSHPILFVVTYDKPVKEPSHFFGGPNFSKEDKQVARALGSNCVVYRADKDAALTCISDKGKVCDVVLQKNVPVSKKLEEAFKHE
jgi:hypothetical protein